VKAEFREENVRDDKATQKREASVVPVLLRDGRISSAEKLSEVLQHLSVAAADCVFIRADLLKEATHWLIANRDQLIQARKETRSGPLAQTARVVPCRRRSIVTPDDFDVDAHHPAATWDWWVPEDVESRSVVAQDA
jgi:hypothetical protein